MLVRCRAMVYTWPKIPFRFVSPFMILNVSFDTIVDTDGKDKIKWNTKEIKVSATVGLNPAIAKSMGSESIDYFLAITFQAAIHTCA